MKWKDWDNDAEKEGRDELGGLHCQRMSPEPFVFERLDRGESLLRVEDKDLVDEVREQLAMPREREPRKNRKI